jgi:hypothetical protein
VLSGQHSDKLQQLQGSLKGQGGGACTVEVEEADATDPDQVMHCLLTLLDMLCSGQQQGHSMPEMTL